MKKYGKKILALAFAVAILPVLWALSCREEVEIGQQEQALLEAIQSPEAVQVRQLGRSYSLRQVGFDPKQPQARCLNYSFFQAENSLSPGGHDTLGMDSAVYFTGDPEQVETIQISHQTFLLYQYQESASFSFFPLRLPHFLLTKHIQYDCQQFQTEHTFDSFAENGFPPLYQIFGPELHITHGNLKGGKVIGGFSRVSGQICCKDGAVYRPEATVAFAASCYA